jgi:hypothetical protein
MDEEERSAPCEFDLLPEDTRYRDEGCELAESCLECPLPGCIYDTPHGKQMLLKARRDDEIVRVYRSESPTLGELARMFKVSVRTVQRVLKSRGMK